MISVIYIFHKYTIMDTNVICNKKIVHLIKFKTFCFNVHLYDLFYPKLHYIFSIPPRRESGYWHFYIMISGMPLTKLSLDQSITVTIEHTHPQN